MPTAISNLTALWNNGATTFTAIKMNVTDTASASASLLLDLQVGGVSRMSVSKNGDGSFSGSLIGSTLLCGDGTARLKGGVGLTLQSTRLIQWSSGSDSNIGPFDVVILRDAAGILAQRNGANAQAFRLYNTFTDAANYERGFMRWASNVLEIGTEAGGTGANRILKLASSAQVDVFAFGSQVARFSFGVAQLYGTLQWITDNTYDIGASGASRPRNMFLAGNLELTTSARIFFGSQISTNPMLVKGVDGWLRLRSGNNTSYASLEAGGLSLNDLPNSDPSVAGLVWNDAGTLKISAG